MLLKATAAVLLGLPVLAASGEVGICGADSKSPACAGLDSEEDALYLVQKDTKHVNRRALQALEAGVKLEAGAGNAQPVVQDVLAAFNAMGTNGDLIQINKGSVWPTDAYTNYIPPYSQHIEGLQRMRPTADGKSFFAMSGAGSEANLFIAEMSTATGAGTLSNGGTPQGTIIKKLDISTEYKHPGGFQVNGDLLAIGVEATCSVTSRLFGDCSQRSRVLFFDVSDPSNPKEFSSYIDRPSKTAGAVGMLKQSNGMWLVIVGDGDDNDLDLYVQQTDGSWSQVASWSKGELLKEAGVSGGWKSYQTHNLILQADGKIFLVATTRDPMMVGHDYFDLYTVQAAGGGRAIVTMVASKAVTCHGCDFYSAAGIYVDSETSLLGYGSSWLPTVGTTNPPVMKGPTINVNEFR